LIARVHKLDNEGLILTLDLTLSALSRYGHEYRRTGDQTLLVEIGLNAETLYVLADTLKDRQVALPPTSITAARQFRSRI
jgi:hypothetical protein